MGDTQCTWDGDRPSGWCWHDLAPSHVLELPRACGVPALTYIRWQASVLRAHRKLGGTVAPQGMPWGRALLQQRETPGGQHRGWGFLGPCLSPGSGGWVREAFAAKIGW